ncbi:MAG: hypothetical protein MSP55_03835 [Fusobacterium necrophorum]|nr:hypothetical protein [Fusobacterium necrophorum]
MKKVFTVLSMLTLGIVFTACSSSNTKIRPMTEVRQVVEQLQTIVTRADRSGVYIAFKNTSDKEMEILWEDSSLGGDQVSHGTYIDRNDYLLKQENTKIKANEIYQTILHRRKDIYYLDPVLYQPGGIKIKALEYPTILILKIKQGETISEMEMEIKQEESLSQRDVDARLQGAKDGNYIPEMTDKTLKLREDKIINKSFNQS